jgi:hypothetical protein
MLLLALTVAVALVPEAKLVEFKGKGKLFIELRAERKEERTLGTVELGAALKAHAKVPNTADGNGPAKAAGIEKGDILVKVNNVYIRQMSFEKLLPLFKKRPLTLLFAPIKGTKRERLCPLRDETRLCCFDDEKHGTCYPRERANCVNSGGEWCGYETADFDL